MTILIMALALFFAVRAFLYFRAGRAFAGLLASLACLLFVAGVYVDYAKTTRPPAATTPAA